MKTIVSEQTPESSVKDCLGTCKQTSNLLVINSHLTKKSMTENSNFTLFIDLNESKTTRTVLGIPLLILALNCKKFYVSFISRGSNSQIFGPK